MKKYIILIFFITSFCAITKGSNRDTTYQSTPDLHRFDGVWEYVSNNITFRIMLKTEKVYTAIYNSYIDLVSGYHFYERDSQVLQNSIGRKKTLTYGFYLEKEKSKNVLKFIFMDFGRAHSADAIVELLPNGYLKWDLKNRERVTVIGKGQPKPKEDDFSFHVPNHLILKKVN